MNDYEALQLRYEALSKDWNRLRDIEREWARLRNIILRAAALVGVLLLLGLLL